MEAAAVARLCEEKTMARLANRASVGVVGNVLLSETPVHPMVAHVPWNHHVHGTQTWGGACASPRYGSWCAPARGARRCAMGLWHAVQCLFSPHLAGAARRKQLAG